MPARKRTAILISGRGSNMAALIDAAAERDFPAEIVTVISDRADALGIGLARARGIEAHIIERAGFPSKDAHDGAIDVALKAAGAEIVCLAGYMRLLTTSFVERWSGRMLNIHPSLLPLFKGIDTHRRALEASMRIHGCSVHFVTPEMDDGPVIAQAAVPILPGDGEAELSARVLKAEHVLYPMALRLVVEGKAQMEGGRVVFSEELRRAADDDSLLLSPPRTSGAIDLERLARFTP